jgi:hypothetical protein
MATRTPSGIAASAAYPGEPSTGGSNGALGWIGSTRMSSRARSHCAIRYAVRPSLSDRPTTAQVAGVVSSARMTSRWLW